MSATNPPKAHTLILITNHFPYGIHESFLESEIPYLTAAFDKVIILARDVASQGVRPVHGAHPYRINPTSGMKETLLAGWLYARHLGRTGRYIRDEIAWLKKNKKRFALTVWFELFHDLTKALVTAHHINKVIHHHRLEGKVTLYSYWLSSAALATTFVSADSAIVKKISRAHGGDVYEQRNALQYLSFRSTLAKNIDRIFCVSAHGSAHLKAQIEAPNAATIQVSRLGTPYKGQSPQKISTKFIVVSCSFIVAVKRLHLVIEALAKIDDVPIHWIHIGNGPLEESIKTLALEKLGSKSNISYAFKGFLSNDDILEFYRKQYVDLFINTSSSEGIPVTMMEAQSFGIPILGPTVGGVPEIITPGTGSLFEADASAETIGNEVRAILLLAEQDRVVMRQKAFENWNAHYNAGNNFSTFVAEILKL